MIRNSGRGPGGSVHGGGIADPRRPTSITQSKLQDLSGVGGRQRSAPFRLGGWAWMAYRDRPGPCRARRGQHHRHRYPRGHPGRRSRGWICMDQRIEALRPP